MSAHRERARQHRAVLDRHRRALRQIRQGRMGGIAQERDPRVLQLSIGGRLNNDQR